MSETPSTKDQAATGPSLRLVRGEALPEELAALIAVLSARASAAAAAGRTGGSALPRHGRWGDPGAAARRVHRPGPGAWRASGLPT